MRTKSPGQDWQSSNSRISIHCKPMRNSKHSFPVTIPYQTSFRVWYDNEFQAINVQRPLRTKYCVPALQSPRAGRLLKEIRGGTQFYFINSGSVRGIVFGTVQFLQRVD